MKALDLSFSAASLAWCRARKAEGWELLIQDIWTGMTVPAPTQGNLANARAAGMLTAGYTVTNLLPGAESVDRAKAAAGAEWEHLRFLAIDVEVTGIPPDVMIRNVRDALGRTRALGKRAIIYTARWFWTGHLGNTTVFKDEPLWNAFYDGDPDIDFPSASYGGFSRVVGEQYQGTTTLAGVQVDLNTFDGAFVKAGQQEEEDMPLNNEDKLYLAGLMRGVLWALADGQMNTSLKAGAPDWKPSRSLKNVMDAIAAIPGGSGGGLSEAQVREIVRQELDNTKLGT